jgi:hypothetical protein
MEYPSDVCSFYAKKTGGYNRGVIKNKNKKQQIGGINYGTSITQVFT